MHQGRWAACASAIALLLATNRADAAGVYENAATESALLVSPQQVTARATVEIGHSPGMEANLFRVLGTFPARSWFLFWVEMPFVSVSDDDGIESGPGDLLLRARAKVRHGDGWGLSLLATVGTGTGNRRFFPYSSQTFDACTSVGYVDSIGAVQPFAIVGYEWVSRVDEDRYTTDTAPASHARLTAGADFDAGPSLHARGGVMQHWYADGPTRTLAFAGARYQWTQMVAPVVEAQAELGKESQRVGDWSLTAGIEVHF
jgi:hypothetical protein